MTPITHNKQVLCKNCIWGTRKDTNPTKNDVVFCEVWQSFRWMLDINREPAAELAHAKAFAINEALSILSGAGLECPTIPKKYKEIKYGGWRPGE